MKISFENDYSEVAHKTVLQKLLECSDEQNNGYGFDFHTENATKLIKQQMQFTDCDIYYLPGGTAINKLVITSFLKPYEAVISASTGHINTHETGAIEAGGHKVLLAKTKTSKLTPESILEVLSENTSCHMVKPKMIYISNTTELGDVYSKSEIEALRKISLENDLYLFIDGARLGSALTSTEQDLSFSDLPNLCDAFYIGGTKNGAMYGEALVLINDNFKPEMTYRIKNLGMLSAKGFNLGIQFEALFENGLYFDIARKENELAKYLYDELEELGFDFLDFCKSNQIFVIVEDELIEKLSDNYRFIIWESFDDSCSVIRLVTSFNTTKKQCDNLLNFFAENMD